MRSLKEGLIGSITGILLSGAGLIAQQPLLLTTGIGLSTIGLILNQQEKLHRKINHLQSQFEQLPRANPNLYHTATERQVTALMQAVEEQAKLLQKQDKALRIQATCQRQLLSAFDKNRYQQKRLLAQLQPSKQLSPQPVKTTVVSPTTPLSPQTVTELPLAVKRIFIDGNNLKYAAEALAIQVDYRALKVALADLGAKHLPRLTLHYYVGAMCPSHFSNTSLGKQLERLDYEVTILPIVEQGKLFKTVGDDVAIATDMMNSVKANDEVILVSGDGDFIPVIQAVQARGAKVIVVGKLGMTSRELSQEADQFIPLDDLLIAQLTKLKAAA